MTLDRHDLQGTTMTTDRTFLRSTLRATTLAAAAALAACGGGSDKPDIPFESKPITVTGTAATSTAAAPTVTALAARPVTIDCRNGHGTAMTDANGNYSVTTTGLSSPPCVVTVTIATGPTAVVLRAIAAGDGSRANITPLTEMLTQYVWAQTGYVFPAGQSDYATQPPTGLTQENRFRDLMLPAGTLAASVARVQAVLQANQVAPAVVIPTDFLTAQLDAKTASNPGNAQSQVIEQLRAKTLTPQTGQTAANVVTAAGLASTQVLARLHVDARARLLP